MKKLPWHRNRPLKSAEIETDDDEFLTIEKWPAEVFKPHFHDSEFNWIVPLRPGRFVFEIEGREVSFSGNEWLCIFPRTSHTVRHVSDDAEVIGLFLPEAAMLAALKAMPMPPSMGSPFIIGSEIPIAQGLALQWGNFRFSANSARDPLLAPFKEFLCGWIWKHYQTTVSEKGNSIEMLVKTALGPDGDKLCKFLKKNLSENPMPWETAAAQLKTSQRTLQRRLQKEAGLSPSDILTRFRLEQSIEELKDPATSLADIALKCGFSSQSHFATAFKTHMGESPGRFRAQATSKKASI